MLLLATLIASCTSDPNTKAQQASAVDVEDAHQQQQIENIDVAKNQQLDQIDRTTGDLKEKTEANTLPPSSEQRAKAPTEVRATRQIFDADSQGRLQKANVRLDAAWRKLQLAGPYRIPNSVFDQINAATRLRSGIAKDLEREKTLTNDRWPDESKRIHARLDELESMVDDIASKADNLSD